MRYLKLFFALCLMALCACTVAHAQEHVLPQKRSITVRGEAEIKVVPDQITLNLTIDTLDPDLDVAKNKNDTLLQSVMSITKKFGVIDQDVKTNYVSIAPRYRDQWQVKDFIGYDVSNVISVTLKDVTRYEDFLSAILKAGVHRVGSASFATSALRENREKARAMALKNARDKAVAMAKELDQKIGKPISISEGTYYDGNISYRSAQVQASMDYEGTVGGQGSLALGTISVNASVTVSFELE